jgi:threonine synthase
MQNRMAVKYSSTRGGESGVSLIDALFNGLAPDGGLYVPDSLPEIEFSTFHGMTFPEIAVLVLKKWIGDLIPENDLRDICHDAFFFEVPLISLDLPEGKTNILELFHGPTLSFKDFGARFMARLMRHFIAGTGKRITVLVATSGDTGSAVADGFAGMDGIRVVLLYPKGQVSPTQERQLTVKRKGVTVCSVDGSFDQCQSMVKQAFFDPELDDVKLSSANSINIGRLLPQMLYYIWTSAGFETPPLFCVPSGNLGNLTAGVMAAGTGLPTAGFLAAHNRNDFFPQWLKNCDAQFSASIRTISNAMDVGAPSNFERLAHMMTHDQLAGLIEGGAVTDSDTRQSMTRIFRMTSYPADPHTAVGVEVLRRKRSSHGEDIPCVVLSTAHPAKFPEIVEPALGTSLSSPRELLDLQTRETSVVHIPAQNEDLTRVVLSTS